MRQRVKLPRLLRHHWWATPQRPRDRVADWGESGPERKWRVKRTAACGGL